MPKSESRLIAGTSEYISPEQGMGKAVDSRSDIYSLGVGLYELLMGRPPFKSDGSFTFVVYQHVHSTPPALEPLNGAEAIPPTLKDLITKCLEKKPESRFQSPEELLSVILKARASLRPAAKTGTVGAPPVPSAWIEWNWRARAVALILVMLAGAACAIFAVLHRMPTSPPAASVSAGDFELLLGVGDFQEAVTVAEKRWGRTSKEYQAAVRRQADSQREASELRAREALQQRDWRKATEALVQAAPGAGAERGRELRAALRLTRDLAQAQELEEKGKPAEALEIYLRYADRVPALSDYLRERVTRLRAVVDRAPSK